MLLTFQALSFLFWSFTKHYHGKNTLIDWLMSKLCSACYAVTTVKGVMSEETVRMTYFSYVHSTMTHDTIFWGNSPYSINNFRVKKKRIIRITTNSKNRVSCRELFKKLKTLPLCSQHIYSILLFAVKKQRSI